MPLYRQQLAVRSLPAAGAYELDTMLDRCLMQLHQSSHELWLYPGGRRTQDLGVRGLPGNPAGHRRFLRTEPAIMLLRKHDLLLRVGDDLDLSVTGRRRGREDVDGSGLPIRARAFDVE